MKLKIIFLTFFITILCFPKKSSCQENDTIRMDGIYWSLISDRPPINMILVIENNKAAQFYEYGRWFSDESIKKDDYSAKEGADFKIIDERLEFTTQEGLFVYMIKNNELKSIVCQSSKKKKDQVRLKFKEFDK